MFPIYNFCIQISQTRVELKRIVIFSVDRSYFLPDIINVTLRLLTMCGKGNFIHEVLIEKLLMLS